MAKPASDEIADLRRELAAYHGLLSAWATLNGRGAPHGCADRVAHDRQQFEAWLDTLRVERGTWRGKA